MLDEARDIPSRDSPSAQVDIALSGGGVRAALFSIGVLIAVLDSRIRTRVSSISSVSGGSITNAVLACSGDFDGQEVDQVESNLRRLARELVKKGSFFLRTARAIAVAAILGVIPVAAILMIEQVRRVSVLVASGIGCVGALLLLGAGVLLLRKYLQIATYASLLRQVCGRDAGRKTLGDFRTNQVQHIFCVTEISSGTPLYMAPSWALSPSFGTADIASLPLRRVLYASAAFPGAFPPLKFKVDRTKWNGGSVADKPRKLWLADGGIFNNLGSEWAEAKAEEGARVATRRGRDAPRLAGEESERPQIVVNASAPPKVANFSWPARSAKHFIRIVTIMYENSVNLRVRQMQDVGRRDIMIDIRDTPVELCERIAADPRFTEEVRGRAQRFRASLSSRSYDYWADWTKSASQVKTTLDSVGRRQGAQLLRHGYLSGAVVLHCFFDALEIDDIRPDSDFEAAVRARV